MFYYIDFQRLVCVLLSANVQIWVFPCHRFRIVNNIYILVSFYNAYFKGLLKMTGIKNRSGRYPNPLNNPEYTKILFSFLEGESHLKKILSIPIQKIKITNYGKRKVLRYYPNEQERIKLRKFSRKLSVLKGLGFIERSRVKYEQRNKIQYYKISISGLLLYITEKFLINLKENKENIITKNKFKHQLYDYLMKYAEYPRLGYEKDMSIHEILEAFVLGIGKYTNFQRFNKRKIEGFPLLCEIYYIKKSSNFAANIAFNEASWP